MLFALRELISYSINPIRVALWVAITGACVISGPFDSGQGQSLVVRFVFWSLAVGYGIVLGGAVNIFARKIEHLSIVITYPVMSVLFATFYSPFLAIAIPLAFPGTSGSRDPVWLIAIYAGMIFLVVMLTILVFTRSMEEPVEPQPEAASTPSILKRLPPNLGREVVRVSSQDHYVEVHTKLGKELILMRFADALEELEGIRGVRVHRSHWVGRGAVAKSRRDGSRVFLVLHDGTEVPVSRSYRADVKAAGLL